MDSEADLTAFILVVVVGRIYVMPSVTGQDGPVHFNVEIPQALDIGVFGFRAVEEIVGLGAAQVTSQHYLPPVLVVLLPDQPRLG